MPAEEKLSSLDVPQRARIFIPPLRHNRMLGSVKCPRVSSETLIRCPFARHHYFESYYLILTAAARMISKASRSSLKIYCANQEHRIDGGLGECECQLIMLRHSHVYMNVLNQFRFCMSPSSFLCTDQDEDITLFFSLCAMVCQ